MLKKKISKINSIFTSQERIKSLRLSLLIALGMVFETLGVGAIIPIATVLIDGENAFLQRVQFFLNADQREMMFIASGALVSIYFAKILFITILTWRQNKFVFDLQARLSSDIFSYYVTKPYLFHLSHNSSELIRNISGEVSIITNYVLIPFIQLASELAVVAGIFLLLLFVEPVGAASVAIFFVVAGLIFYGVTSGKVADLGRKRHFYDELKLRHLQQALGGVKEIKVSRSEKHFVETYRLSADESSRVGMWSVVLQNIPRLWIELLAVAGLGTLICTMIVTGQEFNKIVPVVGVFSAAAFRLMPSANRILGAIGMLKFGAPAIDVVSELALEMNEQNVKYQDVDNLSFKKLELRDVTFRYPERDIDSIKKLNLVITKGSYLGIVGSSGAGKSTLIDLLLGLLEPVEGEILIDGQNISKVLSCWQKGIGYVPQSIYLLDDTLKSNIAFGIKEEDIDSEKLELALKQANLKDFVDTLSEGIDTIVGERGARLSGGQRQRVGLARALYNNPDLLILDEATSALDTDTEIEIMREINQLKGIRTILVIAHRLSTVEKCDTIIELKDGALIRSGAPAEMLGSYLGDSRC